MSLLFGLLSFAALICFIIGMINPKIIVFWTKKKSRGMASLYIVATVIFFVISMATIGTSGTSSTLDTSVGNSAVQSSNTVTSSIAATVYKVGDTVSIMSSGTKVGTLKINSVKATTERNQFDSSTPKQVVIIDYTYTNIADSDKLFISSNEFQVLDSNSTVAETYPVTINKNAQELPIGANCDAQEAYGLKNKSDYITLDYSYNMYDKTPTASFQLKIS